MSLVPLPPITGKYPDGRIRRVLFIEPPGSDGEVAESLENILPGVAAVDQHTKGEVFSFAQPIEDRVIWIYTASLRVWRSATPVVPHGHKGAMPSREIAAVTVPVTNAAACTSSTCGAADCPAYTAAMNPGLRSTVSWLQKPR